MCNLTLFQKGAYFYGIKLFNHLPPRIKRLSNEIKLFKPALKRFLNTHSFYSVEKYLQCSYNLESWFLNNKQRNCFYNCIEYNYVLYTWRNIFDTNYCQAATSMIIIFLMYDNKLFCARYIYKYDNFYILTVIVT